MNEELVKKIEKINKAFSPAAPIDGGSLFSGRIEQLSMLMDAVFGIGKHIVLFGDRGVGKTSISNALKNVVEKMPDYSVIKINSSQEDDFSSLWKRIFSQIDIDLTQKSIGFSPLISEQKISLGHLISSEIKPDDIRIYLNRFKDKKLFIIDEFDRIKDEKIKASFSDLIKSLSDYSVNCTIMLVGVANDVNSLLYSHQSISRSLVQIHMPRMSEDELIEIIDKGQEICELIFKEDFRDFTIRTSQGFPHYVHLISQKGALNVIYEDKKNEIDASNIGECIKEIINEKRQGLYNDYIKATESPRKDNLFKQVITACSLSTQDSEGYFSPNELIHVMNKIMKRDCQISTFLRQLNSFCSNERGCILTKRGERRKFKYKFKEPMMVPFVIIQGLESGIISLDDINYFVSTT